MGGEDIHIKVLDMITSLQNIVILVLKAPNVDEIIILDKDDRPQKTIFCSLVIFIKNFDPINIRRPWAPEITMFCSEVIVIKTFIPREPWPPIRLIVHLFQLGLFNI